MAAIVLAEARDLRAAADQCQRLGVPDRADRLLAQARIIESHLAGAEGSDGENPMH